MVYVSMTRMKLKAFYHLPLSLFHTVFIIRQIQQSPGFMVGKIMAAADLSMWTVTLWQSEVDLNNFYRSGCHAQTSRSIYHWATEAAHAHQAVQIQELPSWATIAETLMAIGHFHQLDPASTNHTQRYISVPNWRLLSLALSPHRLQLLTS